mmetsp:Transcript_37777/g.87327  ORF Transcript_37777/g.87327 Transcript_37777/m.87327 type:complete len:907 (+) Transcript_37777:78-2798(+)
MTTTDLNNPSNRLRPASAVLRWLISAKWCVLSAWFVALGICLPFAPKLVTAARFSLEPVEGTPSYDAQQRIIRDFPFLTHQDNEAVVISCPDCSSEGGGIFASPATVGSIGNFTSRVITTLSEQLASLRQQHPDLNITWISAMGGSDGRAARVASLLPHSPFIGLDNRSTVLQLTWDVSPELQNEALAMFDELDKTVARFAEEPIEHPVKIALTGPLALFEATLKSTQQDLTTKDLFVLPVALLILGFRVRSWRLTLLTLVNVAITVAVSFAAFLPFATYVVEISPLAPSVMVFLSIAFSIDYSLFLFTRWTEELSRGKSAIEALHPMFLHSGEVVCLSGSILILCYLAVLLFPGKGFSSIGLGASLTILTAMLANLTVSPCAIAAFPRFFGAAGGNRTWGCCARGESRHQRFWFSWGKAVTSSTCVVIVPLLAYAVMLPICWQLVRYRENFDNSLTFPWSGEAADAYQELQRILTPGALSPIFILQEGNVTSDAWFAGNRGLAERLMDSTSGTSFELVPKDFFGLAVFPHPLNQSRWIDLTWSAAAAARNPGSFSAAELLIGNASVCFVSSSICEAYRELWMQLSSPFNRSAILRISPPFDPYGSQMQPFLAALRKALPKNSSVALDKESKLPDTTSVDSITPLQRRTSRRLSSRLDAGEGEPQLFSPLVIVFDIMEVIYARLPYILAAVFVSCFLCVSCVFKAACVPLKLFLTVVIPLCMVYGVAVLVYQDGMLNFLGLRQVQGTNGLYWANPVFTTTILIGLALDYDIFLFARVVELRLQGFDNRAAVVGALTLTGPTITAAGLIMTTGFGGLLLTDVASSNQIGFLMAFAVLVDTFVIRTCLVPAILVLASGLNYWPRRLPPGLRGLEDLEKALANHTASARDAAGAQPSRRVSSPTPMLPA